jgi:hypothetical protein
MREQRTLSPAEADARTDTAIHALLIDSDSQRPWSVEEITRELGEDPTDSLNRLYGAGLIHRLDGFVWPSRAAIVAEELNS